MKVYLVGGAVRDSLLGLKLKDRDWVVVGATPEDMLVKGFHPVGKDFPVFLHPDTHEEYALARTERKSGHGYGGFTFYTSTNISLEEDLVRRDLTINAMAQDPEGNIFDPYGGQKDLENKKLRHVSSAFEEDPLRILRVARFAARFHGDGFTIAKETMTLMKKIVSTGEVKHLVAERIWQETARALMELSPAVYFQTLMDCGALQTIMPLTYKLLITETSALTALTVAATENKNGYIRFACLYPPNKTIKTDQLKAFFKQMRFPSPFIERALLINTYLSELVAIQKTINAEELAALFTKTDAFRKPERFIDVLTSSYYLATASTKKLNPNKKNLILRALEDCRSVDASTIVAQGYKGKEIGQQLQLKRINRIDDTIRSQ